MTDSAFPLPDLGEGLIEATVLEWLIAVGDHVERNAALVEVETSKSAVEIPAPRSGTVRQLHAPAGSVVRVGDPLVTFEATADSSGIVGTVPSAETPQRRVRLRPPED